jgi:hypothetical protein
VSSAAADADELIVTDPGVGYRLVAPVTNG